MDFQVFVHAWILLKSLDEKTNLHLSQLFWQWHGNHVYWQLSVNICRYNDLTRMDPLERHKCTPFCGMKNKL